MDSGGSDYLNRRKAQAVGGDEVLDLVVGNIHHVFGFGVQCVDELLKACWRRFPAMPAEFFCVYYRREVVSDSQCLYLESLCRQETIGQEGQLVLGPECGQHSPTVRRQCYGRDVVSIDFDKVCDELAVVPNPQLLEGRIECPRTVAAGKLSP